METQREKARGRTGQKGTVGKCAEEGAAAERIRVWLVMVNRLMRDTLAHVLKRKDLEVAGSSGKGEKSPKELVEEACEVVVVDFVDGDWLSELRVRSAAVERVVPVVAVGMEPEKSEFLEAVRSGVSGYLVKNAGANDVVTAVRAARRGEAICSAQMCMVLFQAVAQTKPEKSVAKHFTGSGSLTLRQQMLLGLVAKGMTNKEIAAQLNLSEFTVRNHVSRILQQLHAESRGDAVHTMRHSQYELRV
jgi:DNA-binding NarL/FixJ family response regulator